MINSDAGTIRKIQDALGRAYGDLGTSPLDRAAAGQILQLLRGDGWMSADEVAFLVDAAGGTIQVTRESIEDKNLQLTVYNEFMTDMIVFKSKEVQT